MCSAFSGKPVSVIVRFSVGGGNPTAADNARSQRNMALQFDLPGGEIWQMGNTCVFRRNVTAESGNCP